MQKPTVSDGPNIEIDVDEKYVTELVELTEEKATYPDAKPDDISLVWKWRLWKQSDGVMVADLISGEPYELWQFSNDKTYRNPKSGKVAKAREWAEALAGRELSDDEVSRLIDEGFAEALVGKRGVADLEYYVTKTGNTRLRIIRLRPYKKPAKAAAPTTLDAEEEERATLPTPAASRARRLLDEAA